MDILLIQVKAIEPSSYKHSQTLFFVYLYSIQQLFSVYEKVGNQQKFTIRNNSTVKITFDK